MIKVSDYIIEFLRKRGVKQLFGLTGGAIVHVFDSAARSGMPIIFHHHEQAAAFAAQAASRVSDVPGVCCVTTGPGVTNAITGLTAAWLDSVPTIYISGQSRRALCTVGKRVRQLGTQELNVLPIVGPLTKYAAFVSEISEIRYHLERAWHEATSGRPGPVWLDIPVDIQWSSVDEASLSGYTPPSTALAVSSIENFRTLLVAAKRPLILAGYGVRRSRGEELLRKWVERDRIPVATTWGGIDIFPSAHPSVVGCPGVAGNRGANLAIQNCDLLIALGSHVNIPIVGGDPKVFARDAKVAVIDIDPIELEEMGVRRDYAYCGDVGAFLKVLLEQVPAKPTAADWLKYIARYRELNGPPVDSYRKDLLSPYEVAAQITSLASDDDIVVVDGGGTNVYVSFQTWQVRGRQRMVLSTGLCSMGSGLPEAIGVAAATGRRVLMFCGDGSFQLNVQELQTIMHHRLPIKVFVSDNGGYLSIRQTQAGFLNKNYIGTNADGGVSLPDPTRIAAAYDMPARAIRDRAELTPALKEVMASPRAELVAIATAPDQELIPRQGFDAQPNGMFKARPLEDMAPYLDRKLFRELMIVKPLDCSQ